MVTKLCLVGAGSIGRRHLKLLLERDDVAVWVVEPNEQCREAVREAHPQVPFCDSMEQAIKEQGCEAVIIATPPQNPRSPCHSGSGAGRSCVL